MYSNPGMSNSFVSSLYNFLRFTEARLQAVLSKNIYSLQGLLPLILPPSGQVCHSLIVVSYCVPGSAQRHAAYAILSHKSFAGTFFMTLLSPRATNSQSSPAFNFAKKLFGTRTLLLLFCPLTVRYASPS